MYKCKECGEFYKIKPEYCNCGNDTFEEIFIEEIKQEENNEQRETNQTKEEKTQKIKPKNTFFDPISTTIFTFCIILSFVIIFYAVNKKTDKIPTVVKIENKKTIIPNINSLWNDETPNIQKTLLKKTKNTELNTNNTLKTKINSLVNVLTSNKQEKAQDKTKFKQIAATTNLNKQEKIAPKSVNIKKTNSQKQINQIPENTKITNTSTPKTTQNTTSKIELSQYKINLRNKIGYKINFAQVIGEGTCVISFTISNTGNIQNRQFKKQSDNFTLNDAVYEAIMQTPMYNPPPSSYHGETLFLTVKFYNGNFEVSLN